MKRYNNTINVIALISFTFMTRCLKAVGLCIKILQIMARNKKQKKILYFTDFKAHIKSFTKCTLTLQNALALS